MITDPQPTVRRLAISMVAAAMRSDAGTIVALLRAVDDGDIAPVVHSALTLARTLAGQLLTAVGMIGADLWLAEAARGHPCRDTRAGAELILAHSQTLGEFDEMIVIGVGEYNRGVRRGRRGVRRGVRRGHVVLAFATHAGRHRGGPGHGGQHRRHVVGQHRAHPTQA